MTAALVLFVRDGYHSVSIHQIQKLADVSIGSIYKYFDGKEGVAAALYKHILGEIEELVDSALEGDFTARERCEALIADLFKHTETHPDIISYAFHSKHSEYLNEQSSICESVPFLKMRNMVKQGIEAGEFVDTDAWVATTAIFGGVSRLIQLRLDGVLKRPLPEYLDPVLSTIWGGLVVPSSLPVNSMDKNSEVHQ